MAEQKATTKAKTSLSIVNLTAVGLALRVISFSCLRQVLVNRVELSSPLVSFNFVEDGIAMLKQGISPYEGDSIHIQPIVLHLFSALSNGPQWLTFAIFALSDLVTAFLLGKSAEKVTHDISPSTVVSCYLLNPITILSCSICSLSVLNNLILGFFVWAFTSGSLMLCAISLGFISHLTVYHFILIGSVFLRFKTVEERIRSFAIALGTFGGLCLLNFTVNRFNWDFIEDTYLFMYSVDDLTPNVGVFWYFFTQVFEHFRFFYISIFQINLLVYLIPLYLTVRNDNNLHLIISMLLIAVFSPYPSLNDAAVYMALLPTLDKYWKEPMRFVLPIACAVVSCVVLMPIMWYMWIINGSGNANFYFAVTIIYNLAQVYLLGDLLFAYFRKETIAVAGNFITNKTSFIFH